MVQRELAEDGIDFQAHLAEQGDERSATSRWQNVSDFCDWIARQAEDDSGSGTVTAPTGEVLEEDGEFETVPYVAVTSAPRIRARPTTPLIAGIDNFWVGAIGVVGPTRMNYARIIPMVDYTARVIGRFLTTLSEAIAERAEATG